MVFQLMRYLAKKGLDLIAEGEVQTLKWYIHKDQREQSLKWITELMIKHQKAFEVADECTLWEEHWGNNTPRQWKSATEQLAKVSPSDGQCEEASPIQARDSSTVRDEAISKVHRTSYSEIAICSVGLRNCSRFQNGFMVPVCCH